jgi:hypothetical protein
MMKSTLRYLDVHDMTQCFAKADAVVVCIEGSVLITEAPWAVADHVFQQRLTLREGEMHRLRASGWTRFTAVRSFDAPIGQLTCRRGNRVARLTIQSTPDWSDRLSQWWARIVQRSIQ